MGCLTSHPVDLRQIKIGPQPPLEKLGLVLRSFQLAFFTSALSIVSFMLTGISKLIIRESSRPDVENPDIALFEQVFNAMSFGITALFVGELLLQLVFGHGLAYLVGMWSLFDTTVVLLLFFLELGSRVGWDDPSSGIWRFLVILRMAHLLSLMSKISDMSIAKKREKRSLIQKQINDTQGLMMVEDQRSSKLKEEIRAATLKLKGMDKAVNRDKMDADVYIRRYKDLL